MEAEFPHTRERLEALYREIEAERMKGVPILNTSLAVAGFGFEPWQDYDVGVLLTPWFMNLMLVPRDQEAYEATAPRVGDKAQVALPAGQIEFIIGYEDGFGYSLSCSLFSPVFEFADLAAAEETARTALAEVLTKPVVEKDNGADADMKAIWAGRLPEQEPEVPPSLPSKVSRRDFLRGDAAKRQVETPT